MNNQLCVVDSSDELKKMTKQRNILFLLFSIICVVFLGYNIFFKNIVNFKITLDINPSVEVSLNNKRKVTGTNGLNDDGNKILNDMNLKGVDYNVAINAILGSMLKNGYIKDNYKMLIGVQSNNLNELNNIKTSVINDTNQVLKNSNINGTIYNQAYLDNENDNIIKDIIKNNNISYNKARFIKHIIEKNPTLNSNELAKMTIEELDKIMSNNSIVTSIDKFETNNNNNVTQNNNSNNQSSQNQNANNNAQPSTPPSQTPPSQTVPPVQNPSYQTPVTPSAPTQKDDAATVQQIRAKIQDFTSRYNVLSSTVNITNFYQYRAQIKALEKEIDYYEDTLKPLLYQNKLTSATYYSLKKELDILEDKVELIEDMYKH